MDLFIQFAVAAADTGRRPTRACRPATCGASGPGSTSARASAGSARSRSGTRSCSRRDRTGSRRSSSSRRSSTRPRARSPSATGAKGPNSSAVTACSTGTHSIGDSFRLIARGDADIMIAGGAEAPITPLSARRVLRHEGPLRAERRARRRPRGRSTPSRDGFVMGEGAGILILEELGQALRRDARIYAEVVGYGMIERRLPRRRARTRRRRRRAGHAQRPGRRRRPAGGRPVHQRPRHLDAAQRQDRNDGHQEGLRRPRPAGRRQLDEVDDRPSPRRGRRRRGRDHAPSASTTRS